MKGKYLIQNTIVVSMDAAIGIIPSCDILIDNGTITKVAQNIPIPSDATIIDGTDTITSPGFIDTHRHTWQTQLRTITSDFVLSDYVAHIRNVYGSCYTANDAYLGNLCGALESIDNGITFLIDHSHIMNSPDHADAAVTGLLDSRIRACFCYGLYENPYWDGCALDPRVDNDNPKWRWDDAKRIKDKYFSSNDPTDRVRFGFAPAEIERSTTDDAAKEVQYGRSLGAAVVTGHIAMGKYDRGVHLVRHFKDRGLLGPDLLFSHAASLHDDELQALQTHGGALSSTPDTETQMGMGHPIAFKAKTHGCVASIGVDITSNNPADMFQQMRLLLQTQRHLDNETNEAKLPHVSSYCEEVLHMATMGGAEAVGLKDVIGSITPGKRADLLITRCHSPRLSPIHNPVAALVLYANGADIDTVFIDGEIVKQHGKLTQVDWPKLRRELQQSADAIMARSKKAPLGTVKAEVAKYLAARAGEGRKKMILQ